MDLKVPLPVGWEIKEQSMQLFQWSLCSHWTGLKGTKAEGIPTDLPGCIAMMGMIRWPMNFPPSSQATILRDANSGIMI